MKIEQYDTELTQSRDISIIGHWVKITKNTIALNKIIFLWIEQKHTAILS